MDIRLLFGLSVLLGFVASGVVAWIFVWPHLRALPKYQALLPLVVLHMFRFVGLSFLVPGVVDPALPASFAVPAAYGDLIAAIMAVLAALALWVQARAAVALVWLLNLWGAADLLFAFYQGLFVADLDARQLGAAFYIPTVVVPILLVTHALMFRLLVRREQR
jgi:hypothetical protein